MLNADSAERVLVRVYCARTCDQGPIGRAMLSAADLKRLGAMTRQRRRTEYLSGRVLLRFALQRWTGRPAHSHRLRTAPDGKPECIDGPDFSVSHSGELVVCAISNASPVGVDVQFPVHRRRTEAIARHYFSPEESAWLDTQQNDCFYMLWVLKEAYLKAVGLGLSGGLDMLRCRIEPPIIKANVMDDAAAPQLALYSVGEAFLAIATTSGPLLKVDIDFCNPDGREDHAPSPVELIAKTT